MHARIFFEWPRGIPNHAKTILCCQLRKFENQYLYPVSRNDISYESLILNPRSQPFKKGLIIDENCRLYSSGSMNNDKKFCVLQNSIYGIQSPLFQATDDTIWCLKFKKTHHLSYALLLAWDWSCDSELQRTYFRSHRKRIDQFASTLLFWCVFASLSHQLIVFCDFTPRQSSNHKMKKELILRFMTSFYWFWWGKSFEEYIL